MGKADAAQPCRAAGIAAGPAGRAHLDLHMPVMDGTEATHQLTARFPEVAIVVLTTYADDDSVLDTLHAGARAYLTIDADQSQELPYQRSEPAATA